MSDAPRSLRHAWRHLAVALLACSALGAQAQKVSMETTAANSVVGLMPQSMAPLWAKAGVDVELAMGQTLTKSQLKIGQGTLDASVIPLPAYVSLVAGKGPYAQMGDKAKAMADNVRSLWAFSASTWHVITWADGKVQNWSDLKGKRVYIGPPAGAANAQIRGLIKAASASRKARTTRASRRPGAWPRPASRTASTTSTWARSRSVRRRWWSCRCRARSACWACRPTLPRRRSWA